MTRDEIAQMMQEAGWSGLCIQWAEPTGKPDWSPYKECVTVPVTVEQIERFAALVAAHEREACLNCYSPDDTATDWADKIRARGQS